MVSKLRYELISIDKEAHFDSNELQNRLNQITLSKLSHCYRVMLENKEMAFVVLDFWDTQHLVVLYEIFLPANLRRQGIGKEIIKQIEINAQSRQFSSIKVYPKSLVADVDDSDLIRWYKSQGYQLLSNNGEMEKILINQVQE